MSMVTSAPQSPTLGATLLTNTSKPNNIWTSEWHDAPFEECARRLKERVKYQFYEQLTALPVGLFDRIKSWCVLSGSSISSMFHGEVVKDFDLWCTNDSMMRIIEDEILDKYENCIMEYSETESYDSLRPGNQGDKKVITGNAITLKGRIQFITLGMYEDQRELFDFVHCKPYYHLDSDKFYISVQQMDCIRNKKLVKNPGGRQPTDWRISKFQKRDWSF